MKYTRNITLAAIAAGLALTSCKKTEEGEEENKTTSPCDMKITNSDAPKTGETFIISDADYSELNVDSLLNIVGDDQTWDFSSISSTEEYDTIPFTSPASIPSGVTANLEVKSDDANLLFDASASGLNLSAMILPEDQENDIEISLTNPLTLIPYTLTKSTSVIDDYEFNVVFKDTIDTIIFGTPLELPIVAEVKQENQNSFTVDGCGTVVTPSGEYDCLRYVVEPGEPTYSGTVTIAALNTTYPLTNQDIEDYGANEDSNFFEGKTYVWINKESGMPILEVTVDSNNDVTGISYLK